MALIALLVALPQPTAGYHIVALNSIAVAVSPGTTLGDVLVTNRFQTRPGPDLDLTGDVRNPAGGNPGRVILGGAASDPAAPVPHGASIVVPNGAGAVEALARREAALNYKTELSGSGPVAYLARKGKTGTSITYLGEKSKRETVTIVVEPPVNAVVERSRSIPAGKKAAALTFDDGPGTYTPKVLEALEKKGVTATFFFIGSSAAANPGMLARTRDAGHEIANHTWDHPDLTTLSAEAIRSQITRTTAVLGDSRYFRPPYGSYNSTVKQVVADLGMRMALWNVDTRDWESRDADSIMAKVKQQTSGHSVVLMHDGGIDRSATVAALPRVIDWLFAQGYALVPLRMIPSG